MESVSWCHTELAKMNLIEWLNADSLVNLHAGLTLKANVIH